MKRFKLYVVILTVLFGIFAHSASSKSGFGFNIALGTPFLTQTGLNYKVNDKLSFSATYNLLDLDAGLAAVKLAMPEILIEYHPFGGSFFLGAGVGQESLEISSTPLSGSEKVEAEVDATTTVVKTGWMWGSGDGGLWFGMDVSYIMPSGASDKITANGIPTTDQAYIDAEDAIDKFGKTSYVNITFFRLGYLF